MKNKLYFFLPNFTGGGAENMIINLINNLYDKGISVELIVLNSKGKLYERLNKSILLTKLNANRMLLGYFKLFLFCLRQKPEIIISTLFQANISILLVQLVTSYPKRIYIRAESNMSMLLLDKKAFSAFLPIMKLTFPFLYRRAEKVICVSKNTEQDLNTNFKINNTITIWNPAVSSEMFTKSSEAIREDWWPNSGKVLLSIGRLTKIKGHHTTIKALKELDDPSIYLVILGEGELAAELNDLIQKLGLTKQVVLPGFVRNPHKFILNCDIFILSSEYEGLSNALIEAIALHKPVIATKVGGNLEALNFGKYGKLFEVGDYLSLSKHINNLSQKSTPNTPDEWIEQFSSQVIYDKYLDLILGGEYK